MTAKESCRLPGEQPAARARHRSTPSCATLCAAHARSGVRKKSVKISRYRLLVNGAPADHTYGTTKRDRDWLLVFGRCVPTTAPSMLLRLREVLRRYSNFHA